MYIWLTFTFDCKNLPKFLVLGFKLQKLLKAIPFLKICPSPPCQDSNFKKCWRQFQIQKFAQVSRARIRAPIVCPSARPPYRVTLFKSFEGNSKFKTLPKFHVPGSSFKFLKTMPNSKKFWSPLWQDSNFKNYWRQMDLKFAFKNFWGLKVHGFARTDSIKILRKLVEKWAF